MAKMRSLVRRRTRRRICVPALRAVPPHDGVRKRRLRPAGAATRGPQADEAEIRARVKELLDLVQLDWPSDRYPASCPVASASASRWRGRWRSSRASCCLMSPSARSTPRCARNCGDGCARCTTEIKMTIDLRHPRPGRGARGGQPRGGDGPGTIEQIGTPGEVYEHPATAFVHGFIGESIVLPVDVRDGGVRLGGKALNIAVNGASAGASRLFVRRHDMQVGPPGSGALEGAVQRVRTFGPDPARRSRAVAAARARP